jgi:hypothetical protein
VPVPYYQHLRFVQADVFHILIRLHPHINCANNMRTINA